MQALIIIIIIVRLFLTRHNTTKQGRALSCDIIIIITACAVYNAVKYCDGADEVKTSEEPGTEADLLKVEVVDEVKASEDHDKSLDEKADTSAVDEEQEAKAEDEPRGELSVDVDKESQ